MVPRISEDLRRSLEILDAFEAKGLLQPLAEEQAYTHMCGAALKARGLPAAASAGLRRPDGPPGERCVANTAMA